MSGSSFVIVGANLTGGAAASTLRTDGFAGRVVMIGEEPHVPYERPPLSKQYLRGEESSEDALLRPRSWYEENDVELVLGTRVVRLHPDDRVVELEGRETLGYDKVLVATGGRNRSPAIPGRDLEGIHGLRTFEDADRIKAELAPGRRAVIVGAGFIGSEVAASLRRLGVEVDVVELLGTPLFPVVGPEVGKLYEAIHRDEGVRFHLGQAVVGFQGGGRVERVITDKGTSIECDLVVIGVGIEPNIEVVEGSGVEVDDGILVDEFCRTTVEGVYAAGDVANHWHPVFGRRMRVEHWDNALKQGAAAARNMVGADVPFDDLHWFWSDQYDYNLQYLGSAPTWDQFVVRGNLEERSFVGFYLEEGLVTAVVGVNSGREVRRSAGLIRARKPVDAAALRDEEVDLKKLGAGLSESGA